MVKPFLNSEFNPQSKSKHSGKQPTL